MASLLGGAIAVGVFSSGAPRGNVALPEPQEMVLVGTTWSPPSGWASYEEHVVPPEGGIVELPHSDRDYRIVAPHVVTGGVILRGGRNIVWIGGSIRIDRWDERASAVQRRALVVADAPDGSSVDGRVVHLEGLLLEGDDLAEGINTNAPSAVVQLQNIHVSLTRIRGADDRDGTGPYDDMNHADVLQTWGAQRELRIDGLTGRSNYQGIFLREEHNRVHGPMRFRHINIEMVETTGEDGFRYAGHRGWYHWPEHTGPAYVDNGTVWVSHHPNGGWVDGQFYATARRQPDGSMEENTPPGSATFVDALYPPPSMTGTDDVGTYATWPITRNADGEQAAAAVGDWHGTSPGRIHAGSPPGGDFVPASCVGVGYGRPSARTPSRLHGWQRRLWTRSGCAVRPAVTGIG